MNCSIDWLDDWLKKNETKPTLRRGIVCYARGRGSLTMETAVFGEGPGFREMGRSQDVIGWRQIMEEMISKEILPLQEDYFLLGSNTSTVDQWAQGLIVKLLEVTP